MKTVLLHEYKYKKNIADNIQDVTNNMYINISDEEFDRINNILNSFGTYIDGEEHENFNNLTPISGAQIIYNGGSSSGTLDEDTLHRIDQIEADIKSLKQDTFYVEEDGLYFTDDRGYVAANLTNTGFHTIGEARDLTITDY